MKVAIDAHFLSKISQGTGTYTYQLLDNLKTSSNINDEFYLLNKEDITNKFSDERFRWKKIKSNRTPINVLYGFIGAMREVDIIHTNYLCPLFAPCHTKRIVTIHDILFKTHSQYFPKKLSLGIDLLTKTCLKRVDKIISVSHYTRDMLLQYYPFIKDKCEVIYEAPGKDFMVLDNNVSCTLKKWNIIKPYILFVGRFAPIKNIDKLVTIYTSDKDISDKYDLVLVGGFDNSFPNTKLKNILSNNGNIKIMSGISNIDLNILYNNAIMLYFISNGEGFGLPILEAMAAGCPVLTSNTTACAEIAADAACLANPDSIEEIYKQMKALLSDHILREELRLRGINHSLTFSWHKCAKDTYNLYKSVL